MSDTQIVVIAMGFMGVLLGTVVVFITKTQSGALVELLKSYSATIEKLTGDLINRADAELVPYGDELKPVHDALAFVDSQVDDPGDWVIKALAKATGKPAEAIIATLQAGVNPLVELTDGEPEAVK